MSKSYWLMKPKHVIHRIGFHRLPLTSTLLSCLEMVIDDLKFTSEPRWALDICAPFLKGFDLKL